MDKKPDVYQALRVYQKIVEFGLRKSNVFLLNGLTANPGTDEYSITIKDEYVSLDIYFHNRYQLDYHDSQSLMRFLDKIETVDKKAFQTSI